MNQSLLRVCSALFIVSGLNTIAGLLLQLLAAGGIFYIYYIQRYNYVSLSVFRFIQSRERLLLQSHRQACP
jgi:hypothetical protein